MRYNLYFDPMILMEKNLNWAITYFRSWCILNLTCLRSILDLDESWAWLGLWSFLGLAWTNLMLKMPKT